MRNYLDVTVLVLPGDDGSYRVRVDSDEGGQGSAKMQLPFTLDSLAGAGPAAAGNSRAMSFGGAAAKTEGIAPERAADLGVALFEALFQGDARDVLMRAESIARTRPDAGLRIRLTMDLALPGMAAVASLPWELMRRRDMLPLVVSIDTPLVRSLDVPLPTIARPFMAPLRVMVLMSNPSGSAPLDLEEERRLIEQSWAKLPGVRVDYIKPTRAELLQALAAEEYHVIHYMGHGDFDEAGGVLLMENEEGGPEPVGAATLTAWLHDEPLRLVVLNACKSATTALRSGEHPFAGIATALIREGVPAVVAMQFPISDKAAIIFSQTFYQRLAMGFPVDGAVAEARKILYSGDHEQPEWATPVLYLRARNGMLFEPAAFSPGPASSIAATAGGGDPWGEGSGPRIFLASVDESLAPALRQVASALRAIAGVRIVDAVDASSREAHDGLAADLVRSADLSVHLLGAGPGPHMNWNDAADPLDTLPLRQLRIGLDAARAQLVLLAPEDRDSIDSRKYGTRIDELAQMPRDKERLEFQVIDRLRFAEAVVARSEALAATGMPAASNESSSELQRIAVVDAHVNDSELGLEVWQYLIDRNVDAALETSSQPAAGALEKLDETVKRASLYVLVEGQVDPAWVKNRNTAIMRSAVKSRLPILVARYASQDPAAPLDRTHLLVNSLNDSDPGWVEALFPGGDGTKA